jgi:hypothetical protein
MKHTHPSRQYFELGRCLYEEFERLGPRPDASGWDEMPLEERRTYALVAEALVARKAGMLRQALADYDDVCRRSKLA